MSENEHIMRPQRMPPEDEALIRLYGEQPTALDALPYTPEFEQLFQQYADRMHVPDNQQSRHDVLMRLLNLRKAGRLPRLRRQVGVAEAEF